MSILFSCSKVTNANLPPLLNTQQKAAGIFYLSSVSVDNQTGNVNYYHISVNPLMRLYFSKKVDTSSFASNIFLNENTTTISSHFTYENHDSTVVLHTNQNLKFITPNKLNLQTEFYKRITTIALPCALRHLL